MSLKLSKNSFLQSLIVGLCDTQIGGFSPILTKKLTKKYFLKSVKKSADFFYQETSADFFVGGEIVWCDTSLWQESGQMSQIFKTVKTIEIQSVRQTEICDEL